MGKQAVPMAMRIKRATVGVALLVGAHKRLPLLETEIIKTGRSLQNARRNIITRGGWWIGETLCLTLSAGVVISYRSDPMVPGYISFAQCNAWKPNHPKTTPRPINCLKKGIYLVVLKVEVPINT